MLKSMSATLRALVHFEIPENLTLLTARFDEAFAARDELQAKILQLSSMLHDATLQRAPEAKAPVQAKPKAKKPIEKKPTEKSIEKKPIEKKPIEKKPFEKKPPPDYSKRAASYAKRIDKKPSDPKPPASLVARLDGNSYRGGRRIADDVRAAVIAWAQGEIKKGHSGDAIARGVSLAPATVHHWLAVAKANPKPVWCAACKRDHFPIVLPADAEHGSYAYRKHHCRCHVCYSTKKQENEATKRARQAEAAKPSEKPTGQTPTSVH